MPEGFLAVARWFLSPRTARDHAEENAVAPDAVMPERRRRVRPGKREQHVGEQLMDFLGGLEDGAIRGDAEVEP